MEFVHQFIQQYKSIPQKKLAHWWNNVHDNVEYTLKVMDFIEKHIEQLEESLDDYYKKEIHRPFFVREWLQYGISLLCGNIQGYKDLPPDVEELWPMFFDESHPTFEGYDISFQQTQKLVKKRSIMYSIYKCDVPDILDLHTGKKCDCWYDCSLCDKQEQAWKKIVDVRFPCANYLFLHKDIQTAFIEKWIEKHALPSMKSWPPIKVYHRPSEYWHSKNKKSIITDFADMCAFIKEDRKRYTVQGKTPIQCYETMPHDIQWVFNSININDSDFTIFMKLWPKIELIPIWMAYDKPRCKEILQML